MNWEIFGWCVASFIILEVIFIIMLKMETHDTWGESKIYAFLITFCIVGFQVALVFCVKESPKYINLLWEFLIVVGAVAFISLNYFIASKFGKVD